MSDAKAIERANSYRMMMDQWAWKDFDLIMDDTRKNALEKAVFASSMEEVQIQRGIVKCIDSLKNDVGFILNGTGK